MSCCCRKLSLALALAAVAACPASDPAAGGDATPPQDAAPPDVAGDPGPVEPDAPSPHALDHLLRLHHIQVKGTHNSFHQEPETLATPEHAYTLAPLDVQLAEQGVRAFELDIHNAEDGDGFAVYHIYFVDPLSSCDAFTDCLLNIKGWSDAHPTHLPIAVWLEPKDDAGGGPIDDVTRFDDDIRAVFPPEQLLTPDDVRGQHASLRAALEAEGWPTLGEVRGRVMFLLLDSGSHRDRYLEGGLEGKAIFPRASTNDFDQSWAAVTKINDPKSADQIQAAHAARLLVASNLCGIVESAEACAEDLAAGLANGVHMLKTDRPVPVEGAEHWTELPDARPARCNEVTAPPECYAAALESL